MEADSRYHTKDQHPSNTKPQTNAEGHGTKTVGKQTAFLPNRTGR